LQCDVLAPCGRAACEGAGAGPPARSASRHERDLWVKRLTRAANFLTKSRGHLPVDLGSTNNAVQVGRFQVAAPSR